MNVDVTPKFNCYLYSKLTWVELGVKLNINKLGLYCDEFKCSILGKFMNLNLD
jgi:hypothetical protein